jgi:hypothetical protein
LLGDQSHGEWEADHEDGVHYGLNAIFEEFGILPADQHEAGLRVIKENYEETVRLAKEGNMNAINPEHYLKVQKLNYIYFLLIV